MTTKPDTPDALVERLLAEESAVEPLLDQVKAALVATGGTLDDATYLAPEDVAELTFTVNGKEHTFHIGATNAGDDKRFFAMGAGDDGDYEGGKEFTFDTADEFVQAAVA